MRSSARTCSIKGTFKKVAYQNHVESGGHLEELFTQTLENFSKPKECSKRRQPYWELGNAFNKKPDSCNPLLMTFKYSLWQNCIRAWERFTIAQSIYCCTNNSQVIEEFKKALVILKMTYGEDNPTLL